MKKTAMIILAVLLVLACLAGCSPAQPAASVATTLPAVNSPTAALPTAALAHSSDAEPEAGPAVLPASPTVVASAGAITGSLSADERATLSSLAQVDDYPLYTLRYTGDYRQRRSSSLLRGMPRGEDWACSLFAALGDPKGKQFGRNFDWQFSPALVLFTDPPVGYASVSMVDITYLDFGDQAAKGLLALSLDGRSGLLDAPFLPFDGMNEKGLAVGMAAVSPGHVPEDPAKPTIGSLGVMREILDNAANVSEAVAILQRYNIDFEGGPPLHYLVADVSGQAALVEFSQGRVAVTSNQNPWLVATNFIVAETEGKPEGSCWRYDQLTTHLSGTGGQLAEAEGLALLKGVSQGGTQWSALYNLSSGQMQVVMGREYQVVHSFQLDRQEVK